MTTWIDVLEETLKKVNSGVKKIVVHPNSVVMVYYTDFSEQGFFPDVDESRTDFVLRIINGVMVRKVGVVSMVERQDYNALIEADREELIAKQQVGVAQYHSQTVYSEDKYEY